MGFADELVKNTKSKQQIEAEEKAYQAKLRKACDKAETLTSEKYWPFPTYGKLLFGVR